MEQKLKHLHRSHSDGAELAKNPISGSGAVSPVEAKKARSSIEDALRFTAGGQAVVNNLPCGVVSLTESVPRLAPSEDVGLDTMPGDGCQQEVGKGGVSFRYRVGNPDTAKPVAGLQAVVKNLGEGEYGVVVSEAIWLRTKSVTEAQIYCLRLGLRFTPWGIGV